MPNTSPILIFRTGSLGDHIVSLPCINLVARRFPDRDRILLTNVPSHPKAPAAMSLYRGSGLIGRAIEFPANFAGNNSGRALSLIWEIRNAGAKTLVYLPSLQTSGIGPLLRDLTFFRLSGIRHIFGLPLRGRFQHMVLASGMLESEASRLARTLRALGEVNLGSSGSWDLHLSAAETESSRKLCQPLDGMPLFAIAIESSVQSKNWDLKNWQLLMPLLHKEFSEYGIIFLGALQDRISSDEVLRCWPGRAINLCGDSTPRESAAIFSRCDMFFGVDSAPMHLAASRRVRCVIVFAARTLPGIWFPQGDGHEVLYSKTSCSNCRLDVCIKEKQRCLSVITPTDVLNAALRIRYHLLASRSHPLTTACENRRTFPLLNR